MSRENVAVVREIYGLWDRDESGRRAVRFRWFTEIDEALAALGLTPGDLERD